MAWFASGSGVPDPLKLNKIIVSILAATILIIGSIMLTDKDGVLFINASTFINGSLEVNGTYNGLSIIDSSDWIYISGDGSIENGFDISIPKHPNRDFYYGYGGLETHYFGNAGELMIHSDGNLMTTGDILNHYNELEVDNLLDNDTIIRSQNTSWITDNVDLSTYLQNETNANFNKLQVGNISINGNTITVTGTVGDLTLNIDASSGSKFTVNAGEIIMDAASSATIGSSSGGAMNFLGGSFDFDTSDLGRIIFDAGENNYIVMLNLPTSNPGGSGRVWNDGGILKIT